MNIKNTPTKWGLNVQDFENNEWGNVLGTLKVPTSYLRRMQESYPIMDAGTNPTGVAETTEEYNLRLKTKIFNNLAQIYIDGITLYFNILRQVEFDLLLSTDKDLLRELIYEAVQHAVLNRNVFEEINNSNIQQGGFQMNKEATGWLLTINMYGKRAWSKMHNSEISKYKVIGDDFIGKVLKDSGDKTIVAQWDNQTRMKNWGDFPSVFNALDEIFKLSTLERPTQYDYISVTDANGTFQYRLDGDDWDVEANWKLLDSINIEGTKYLVKDKMVLASSKGPKGDTGNGIVSSSYDGATGILTLTYTDGTTTTTTDLRGHNIMNDTKIVAAEQEVANV